MKIKEILRKYEPNNDNLSIKNKMFHYIQNNIITGTIKKENTIVKTKFYKNMYYDDTKIIINNIKTMAQNIDAEIMT